MKHSDEIVLDGVTYVRKEEPKKPVERREFTVLQHGHANRGLLTVLEHAPFKRYPLGILRIDVREVLEGEISFTLEQLTELWKKHSEKSGYYTYNFNDLCKMLGFK